MAVLYHAPGGAARARDGVAARGIAPLAGCDDSTAPITDPADETLAAQIRQMSAIDVICV